jgi:hypothetical protein
MSNKKQSSILINLKARIYAEDVAMEADWIREGDEHYCTDCFEYDDDDNLIIHKGGNK